MIFPCKKCTRDRCEFWINNSYREGCAIKIIIRAFLLPQIIVPTNNEYMELACPRCKSTDLHWENDTTEYYGSHPDEIRVMVECNECGKHFDVRYTITLKEIEE